MAPFATMILALPAMLLEGGGVIDWFYTHDSIVSALVIILGSGVLAFCLNFSIFYVIHSTTAVTFNVAGNLKVGPFWAMFSSLKFLLFLELNIAALQVAVAVLVSWLIFRNPISPMNAIGCAITLVGCTFYGYVRHLISQQQAAAPGSPRTNSPRSRVEMLPLVGEKQDKV
jgi:drug/metabolite transporter (DMT)-like permease